MSIFYIFLTLFLQVSSISPLVSSLENFQERLNLKKSTVSASIKSCTTGNTILNYNANKAINSASTLKLITTGLILEEVGENFTYKTTFAYSGSIVNQILEGNLYIFGEGDPSFASNRYGKNFNYIASKITEKLKSLGVKQINGHLIVIDDLYLNYDFPENWAWNDIGNYFGAIPYQLNFNENQFDVYFKAGSMIGTETTVQRIEPLSKQWHIINQVKTAETGTGDQVYVYSSPLDNTILLKGTIPLGVSQFKVKGSIPNPAAVFGELLKDYFEKNNLPVSGDYLVEKNSQNLVNIIFDIKSPPMETLIRDCNFNSINLYADAFMRLLALKKVGNSYWNSGVDAMKLSIQQKGLSASNFQIFDGSGLSPQGTITTDIMTDFLKNRTQTPQFTQFLNSIPIAGKSGTVSALQVSSANGVVFRIKSGTIQATRAYAGYFYSRTNELICFMVVVNRFDETDSKEVKLFLQDFIKQMGQNL